MKQNCLFKIYFPDDFKVTSNLVAIDGSGFFEPLGSGLQFTPDLLENSVTIKACKKNFGYFTSGIVQFQNILNQPFVHDTETFKIYMTDENDINFLSPYQILESNFIIREAQ